MWARSKNGAANRTDWLASKCYRKISSLRRDRSLAQPGFTAVLMITLALGIGANTAVFSVLRAVLLDPIPLPEPDRVVLIWEQDRLRGTTRENASYPDYLDLKQSSRHFTDLAATQSMDVTLTGNGEAERVAAARVTHEFFKVLGLTPIIGRVFGPGEDGVVLSHSLWERKFASSTSVLGTVIRLDGFSGTVVGVLPAEANSFRPRSAELWTSLENVRASQFRGQHSTGIIGRLQRSSSITQAQAEISVIMSRLEKDFPDDNLGRGAKVVPLHEELAGNMRPALQALSIAVFVLLLIASVNIANLLLARASSRNREMAIRVSLGAGRWRLARQLLTESLFLAIFGVALGMITAWWGVRGLIVLAPPDTPLIGRAGIDGSVLLMTFAVTLVAWLIFGLLPALRASIVAPTSALQTSGRNTASRSTLRLRHALVIAQIAMAVVLVIFSGLLIRSFWRLRQVNLGYEPQGAISLRVKLPETRYPFPKFPFREWPAVIAFSDRLKTAALETPGVEAVSLASNSPAHGAWTTRVTVDGRPKLPDGEQKEAQFRTADPDYLKTTRIRLLRGRFFERSDDEKHPLVAVVNEAFVRDHFSNEDPVGQHINVFGMSRLVVGIIGDVRYAGPGSVSSPAMYFPLRQAPFPNLTLIARTGGNPSALAPGLRQAVFVADPNVAPFDLMTLERSLLESTARERFIMSLLTGFACLALLLASVGIYGVVAYSAGRRRKEIAVRLALGARALDIFSQIVGGTLARAAVGILGGIAISVSLGRLLQPLVFETSTRDVTTYLAVAFLIISVAFLGAALPATRAARVNAATTLREE